MLLSAQNTYRPISFNNVAGSDFSDAIYLGEGRGALLNDGIVYQIDYDGNFNFTTSLIDNAVPGQRVLYRYDVNQDGRDDLLTKDFSSPLATFISRSEYLDDVSPFFAGNVQSFAVQDFDDDGIDELLVNGRVYKYDDDGELQLIMDRSPSNGYQFKAPYMIDLNGDGYKDVLFKLVTNMGWLRNNGEDRFNQQNIPLFQNRCQWFDVIETSTGPILLYYSTGGNINIITAEEGVFSEEAIVENVPNYGYETIAFDFDSDGSEELLVYNNTLNRYNLLDIDSDTGNVTFDELGLEGKSGLMIIDDAEPFKIVGFEDGIATVYEMNPSGEVIEIGTSRSDFDVYQNSFVDLDGDGLVDVWNPNFQRSYLGDDSFGDIRPLVLPVPGGELRDFDGDGDADYVTEEFWYFNQGTNIFGPAQSNPEYNPYPDPEVFFTEIIYEGDIDQDGDVDIITYNSFGEPLELRENLDNTSFADPKLLADSEVLSGSLLDVSVQDFDGNGSNDLLMTVASGLVYFSNLGGVTFDQGVTLFEGFERPRGIDIKDADGDGTPEIVLGTGNIMAGTASGQTILYKGTSDGPVLYRTLESSGGYKYPRFIDHDEIGVLDVLVGDGNDLYVYAITDYDSDPSAKELIKENYDVYGDFDVVDVDGDQDDDIILFKEGSIEVQYLLKNEQSSASACPRNDVVIYDQQTMDRYVEKYGSCTEINGNVTIGPTSDWSDFTSIRGFENVTHIEGSLRLRKLLGFNDLRHLSNLEEIGQDFVIDIARFNSSNGLQGVKRIGRDLIIDNVLIDEGRFGSLVNLEHVGRHIDIVRANLIEIYPLAYAHKLHGDFRFVDTYGSLQFITDFQDVDTIIGTLQLTDIVAGNMSRLSNIKYLGGLDINGQNIGLVEMNLSQDSIPDLMSVFLPQAGSEIRITNNIKHVGSDFDLRAESIGEWHDIETVDGRFLISTEQIDDLSFNKLKEVESFTASILDDDHSNFGALQKVKETFSLGWDTKSLEGLSSLDSIGRDFYVGNNDKIRSLAGINNNTYVGERIWLINSPLLEICDVPFVCNHINEARETVILANGSSCDDISDISCAENSISGVAFYDTNQDGVFDEGSEARLANVQIDFEGDPIPIITSDNGFYRRAMIAGESFGVTASVLPGFEFTTSNFYEVDSFIPDVTGLMDYDFGMYSNTTERVYESALTSSLFICNRPFEVALKATNISASASTGFVELTYSEELSLDPTFTDFLSHDFEARVIRFSIEELNPYFSLEKEVPFIAPSADEIDNEDMSINIAIFETENGSDVLVQEDRLPLSLLCSYDPNDKLVSSTDRTGNIRVGVDSDELIYTIRFQNTGNFYAEDVRITDDVSTALDLDSYKFVDASHDVKVTFKDRQIIFSFDDIFLVDSTESFLESQGFVSFSIKPINYDLGLEIDNEANIYFDFNDPILTNTAESIVYDPTLSTADGSVLDFDVYPQPAKDYVVIRKSRSTQENASSYKIVNGLGKIMRLGRVGAKVEVDVSDYPSGLYYVILMQEDVVVASRSMVITK